MLNIYSNPQAPGFISIPSPSFVFVCFLTVYLVKEQGGFSCSFPQRQCLCRRPVHHVVERDSLFPVNCLLFTVNWWWRAIRDSTLYFLQEAHNIQLSPQWPCGSPWWLLLRSIHSLGSPSGNNVVLPLFFYLYYLDYSTPKAPLFLT